MNDSSRTTCIQGCSSSTDAPSVAIVHDYLTQRGGAERVVLSMGRTFPGAPIFTSLYEPSATYPDFERHTIQTSSLQRLPALRRHHRLALPLYASTFGRTVVNADVTICSTSGWAHGVRVNGRKLLYVHNTARWLYQSEEYLRRYPAMVPRIFRAGSGSLRHWDWLAARSADCILTNSYSVRQRIATNWGLDATVLYPPHTADPDGPEEAVEGIGPGYILVVARLLAYKRVDVVVDAIRLLPDARLVVVGDGQEAPRLRSGAPQNCTFLSKVSDRQLRWLYRNCRAVVSAASEDFGLVPLEAMAFGRPAIVIRQGGFVETVSDGESGIFFEKAEPRALASAILRSDEMTWDSVRIRCHADRFSERAFRERLREVIGDLAERT
jgi:glycosyltransferase involved in cell wall biosynthesis